MKNGNEIVVTDELIVKYLSGEADPQEAMVITDWLAENEHKLYFEKLAATWHATFPLKKQPSFNKQNAWSKLDSEIKSKSTVKIFQPGFLTLSRHTLKIAASIFFFLVSGLLIFLKVYTPEKMRMTTSANPKTITFPDHSKAALYRYTTITFPQHFKNDTREVNLIAGEAFFVISPDALKPFIIHTILADIKVVGTEFNVVTKKDQVVVSVKEGKVLVYTAKDSMYLGKGSSGIITSGKDLITSRVTINSNAWAYATRSLVFKNTSLTEVITDIEKAYPYSIRVSNDHINKCQLTATFNNDSVEKIVTLIAETLNLTVKKNGHVFILEGEGCP